MSQEGIAVSVLQCKDARQIIETSDCMCCCAGWWVFNGSGLYKAHVYDFVI